MTIELAARQVEPVTPEEAGFSSERLQRLDDAMRRLVDAGKLPGIVTLVARQGKVAHFATTGSLDVTGNRQIERDAIFRIASMTKPITCTAVMMLFEEGRFLLDHPVAAFLPEFADISVFVRETAQGVEVADLERPITIRHLLMHTAGFTSPSTEVAAHPVARLYAREQVRHLNKPLADSVRRLAGVPLVHQPGSAFTYGISHDVLGRLIEIISGQAFDDFLSDRIFGPLDMTDTGFHVPARDASRLATVHVIDEAGYLRPTHRTELDVSKPPVYLNGGGGLVSTAADYARFCQMLLDGGVLGRTRLLGRKTVELMTANHWTGTANPFPTDWGFPDGYGFGLGMRVLVNPAQSGLPGSVGEYGWAGAYSTYFWIDPSEHVFGIFLAQFEPMTLRYAYLFQALVYQALTAPRS
jgi:CubicO group peptidase (beta-lactamase class C family)